MAHLTLNMVHLEAKYGPFDPKLEVWEVNMAHLTLN